MRRKGVVKGSPFRARRGVYSTPALERSRFPLLPREFNCALCYEYHDERTGGQTTQASRNWPLLEFNTQLPRYAAELYQIYRHARIMAIDVSMSIVNTSNTEVLFASMGCLPLANVNAITNPQQIVAVPGSVRTQIGLSTGTSVKTLRKRFVSEKELGELTAGSNTYLQTYSEALSAAVWTELPCIYAGVIASRSGASWTGIIDYRVTYHIRWSEYSIPALGVGPGLAESMEEDSYVEPEPPVLVDTRKSTRSRQTSAASKRK